MRRFLELLAAHPDEWLSIDEVREELGMKTHQLPGVLGAFQRRWQGRYRLPGRLPFGADDADDGRRYRMPKENAELIASLGWTSAGRSRTWTEEDVFAALADDPKATGVVRDLIAWAARSRLLVEGTTMVKPGLVWHLKALGTDYRFFNLDTGFKQVNIQSNSLSRKPLLDHPSRRAALVAALNEVYPIPPERADKVPSIPFAALADESAFRPFTAAWDAVIADIRRAEADRQ
jgi:hypothetical protein